MANEEPAERADVEVMSDMCTGTQKDRQAGTVLPQCMKKEIL